MRNTNIPSTPATDADVPVGGLTFSPSITSRCSFVYNGMICLARKRRGS